MVIFRNFVRKTIYFRLIFHKNSKNKNWRIFFIIFPMLYNTLPIIHKRLIKSEGEGVCISLIVAGPKNTQQTTFLFNRGDVNAYSKSTVKVRETKLCPNENVPILPNVTNFIILFYQWETQWLILSATQELLVCPCFSL